MLSTISHSITTATQKLKKPHLLARQGPQMPLSLFSCFYGAEYDRCEPLITLWVQILLAVSAARLRQYHAVEQK